jgi:LPS-assembly lipoprotein
LYRLLVIAVALVLSGCGFRLQDAVTVPSSMDRTYIDTADEYSLFYRELRQTLNAAGVELVDSPEPGTAILSILNDRTGQRVLSVSARNVPTEYEVYYSIEYTITAGERVLLSAQDVTLTRDYTYDTTLVLGKSREESMLREALVNDLVRIVLKQISSL